MTTYSAGWNALGQSPVTQQEFDDFTRAARHLVREVERLWDEDYAIASDADSHLDSDNVWLPVHTALHHAGRGPTFFELTGDGRLEFWIRQTEPE